MKLSPSSYYPLKIPQDVVCRYQHQNDDFVMMQRFVGSDTSRSRSSSSSSKLKRFNLGGGFRTVSYKDYKTMNLSSMEACQMALSNFEVGQNYKDVSGLGSKIRCENVCWSKLSFL